MGSPELGIRRIDVDDDVVLRRAYDVQTRAVTEGRGDPPHWSWPEFAGTVRRLWPGQVLELHGGFVEGRLIGYSLFHFSTLDNLEKAQVSVVVDPAEQHRGHGRRLLARVCDLVTERGRGVLLSSVDLPFEEIAGHRRRRFAEAAGFALSNVEIVRHLDLPISGAEISGWDADPRAHAGYRLQTFEGNLPEELAASYCEVYGQLVVDAPTGDVDFEEERMTPAELASSREALAAQGRRVLETLAVTPDGVVAAFSTLMVPPEPRRDVSQWGTFVHRAHRGHRLGMATKAANLRELQRRFPGMRRVVTQNAETNRWMIAINEDMGFEPVEARVELVRR